jgi:hypothetical protein
VTTGNLPEPNSFEGANTTNVQGVVGAYYAGGVWNVIDPDQSASGSIVANGGVVTISVNGDSACGILVTGTWTMTLSFEASVDGVTFAALEAFSAPDAASVVTTAANGTWIANVAGYAAVRVRCSAFTSGTANVTLRASAATVGFKGSGSAGGTSSNFAAAFPAAGTAAGFSDGVNMQGARVYDVDTGAGFEYAIGTVLRLPASGGSTAVSASNPLPVTGTVTAAATTVTDSGATVNLSSILRDAKGILLVADPRLENQLDVVILLLQDIALRMAMLAADSMSGRGASNTTSNIYSERFAKNAG